MRWQTGIHFSVGCSGEGQHGNVDLYRLGESVNYPSHKDQVSLTCKFDTTGHRFSDRAVFCHRVLTVLLVLPLFLKGWGVTHRLKRLLPCWKYNVKYSRRIWKAFNHIKKHIIGRIHYKSILYNYIKIPTNPKYKCITFQNKIKQSLTSVSVGLSDTWVQ